MTEMIGVGPGGQGGPNIGTQSGGKFCARTENVSTPPAIVGVPAPTVAA
jgi:hypothetical protein